MFVLHSDLLHFWQHVTLVALVDVDAVMCPTPLHKQVGERHALVDEGGPGVRNEAGLLRSALHAPRSKTDSRGRDEADQCPPMRSLAGAPAPVATQDWHHPPPGRPSARVGVHGQHLATTSSLTTSFTISPCTRVCSSTHTSSTPFLAAEPTAATALQNAKVGVGNAKAFAT